MSARLRRLRTARFDTVASAVMKDAAAGSVLCDLPRRYENVSTLSIPRWFLSPRLQGASEHQAQPGGGDGRDQGADRVGDGDP
ncbi:hypothetical protein GCM10009775_10870 [Microbacterium aoyamense]|uniref:Uncharacterized protein n=1 Tax=Microbacterium aoyamense TaxID=344166 RepID=A0ABN2PF11_9MICO